VQNLPCHNRPVWTKWIHYLHCILALLLFSPSLLRIKLVFLTNQLIKSIHPTSVVKKYVLDIFVIKVLEKSIIKSRIVAVSFYDGSNIIEIYIEYLDPLVKFQMCYWKLGWFITDRIMEVSTATIYLMNKYEGCFDIIKECTNSFIDSKSHTKFAIKWVNMNLLLVGSQKHLNYMQHLVIAIALLFSCI
jgi:hypothetical protein